MSRSRNADETERHGGTRMLAHRRPMSLLIVTTRFAWRIAVSDRATLRGLTQFLRRSVSARPQTAEYKSHRGTVRFEGGFCDTLFQTARKSLILNGEMSEWSIEHAWKTIPASLTERHQNTSSRNRFSDLPPPNASRCDSVN